MNVRFGGQIASYLSGTPYQEHVPPFDLAIAGIQPDVRSKTTTNCLVMFNFNDQGDQDPGNDVYERVVTDQKTVPEGGFQELNAQSASADQIDAFVVGAAADAQRFFPYAQA